MEEPRRPGIHDIAKRLKRENPSWTRTQVLVQAKVEWQKEYDKKFAPNTGSQQLSDPD